ncbi:MAG TPA: hypothetical protein VIW24_16155, partial [Aldersonia sp.]
EDGPVRPRQPDRGWVDDLLKPSVHLSFPSSAHDGYALDRRLTARQRDRWTSSYGTTHHTIARGGIP